MNIEMTVSALVSGDKTALKLHNAINDAFFDDYKRITAKAKRDGLHASELKRGFRGKTRYCFAQQTLNKFFYPSHYGSHDLDIETIRQYKLGWYIHLMFQKLFSDAGYSLEAEVTRVDSKYGVYYTIDIIARFHHLSSKKYIVEIKSMNTKRYKQAVLIDDPKRSHPEAYKQAQIYMLLTQADANIEEVDRAITLIYNKDTSDFYLWEYGPDEKFLKPYRERLTLQLRYHDEYEKRGAIPDKACENAHVERAKECPMAHVCWGEKTERLKYKRDMIQEKQQKNASLLHEGKNEEKR